MVFAGLLCPELFDRKPIAEAFLRLDGTNLRNWLPETIIGPSWTRNPTHGPDLHINNQAVGLLSVYKKGTRIIIRT